MSDQRQPDGFHEYLDDLFENGLNGDEPLPREEYTMPDGTYFDWDEALKATVEFAPDGRRYVVKLVGSQLVRIEELRNVA